MSKIVIWKIKDENKYTQDKLSELYNNLASALEKIKPEGIAHVVLSEVYDYEILDLDNGQIIRRN